MVPLPPDAAPTVGGPLLTPTIAQASPSVPPLFWDLCVHRFCRIYHDICLHLQLVLDEPGLFDSIARTLGFRWTVYRIHKPAFHC